MACHVRVPASADCPHRPLFSALTPPRSGAGKRAAPPIRVPPLCPTFLPLSPTPLHTHLRSLARSPPLLTRRPFPPPPRRRTIRDTTIHPPRVSLSLWRRSPPPPLPPLGESPRQQCSYYGCWMRTGVWTAGAWSRGASDSDFPAWFAHVHTRTHTHSHSRIDTHTHFYTVYSSAEACEVQGWKLDQAVHFGL